MSIQFRVRSKKISGPEGHRLVTVEARTEYCMGVALFSALISNAVSTNFILPHLLPDFLHAQGEKKCTRDELKDFFLDSSIDVIVLTLLMSAVPAFLILYRVHEKLKLWARILLGIVIGTLVGCCFTYFYDLSPPACKIRTNVGHVTLLAFMTLKMLITLLNRREEFWQSKKQFIFMDYFCSNFMGGMSVGANYLERSSFGILGSYLVLFFKIPEEMFDIIALGRCESRSNRRVN